MSSPGKAAICTRALAHTAVDARTAGLSGYLPFFAPLTLRGDNPSDKQQQCLAALQAEALCAVPL